MNYEKNFISVYNKGKILFKSLLSNKNKKLDAIFARHEGILETDLLKDRKVVFIGLGSLGSPVAMDLARSGVRKFSLVDPDVMDLANISRHICGFIGNIGKEKNDIIANAIAGINPEVIVCKRKLRIDWDTIEQLRVIIKGTDLVVLTADSHSVKSVVNKVALEEGVPFLWGGCYRRAYGGQILLVAPGRTPCYECYRHNIGDDDDSEISSERSAKAPAYSDIEIKAEPGLVVDIAPIATMLSKLAIQQLLRGKVSTLHSLDEDLDCNYYMYFSRREGKAEHFVPMSNNIEGLRILSWMGVKMPFNDNCMLCKSPDLSCIKDSADADKLLLEKLSGALHV